MPTEIEKIALDKLKEILMRVHGRIQENVSTPERQDQYVLPSIKTEIVEAFKVINAIENQKL